MAAVVYRRSGLSLFHARRSTKDIGLGGARILCDERMDQGDRLDLELLLPDETWLSVWAEVAWTDAGTHPPPTCEVGLRFTDIADEDFARLASVLVRSD